MLLPAAPTGGMTCRGPNPMIKEGKSSRKARQLFKDGINVLRHENSLKNPNQQLFLLRTSEKGVWIYPVLGLEEALTKAGVQPLGHQASEFFRFLTRLLARAGMVRNFWTGKRGTYLAILMGPAEYRLFPYCYGREMIIYCFDCWPAKYARWEAIFRRNRIRLAFFSARRSAEHFSRKIPEMQSVWLPEAVNPEAYRTSKRLAERSIDVLELGRKYEAFHQRITPGL